MEDHEPAFGLADFFHVGQNGGTVSSVACSTRFIAVGTSRGHVHVLDLIGNEISYFNKRHESRVSGLSFGGGRFGDDVLASVGRDDRTLIVTSTIAGTVSGMQDFRAKMSGSAALNGVAIDPSIDSAPQGKRFAVACSDGKVQIHTASWFIGSQSTLREGEGEVTSISWEGHLLAWVTPTIVRVFDMTQIRGVCMIDLQKGSVPLSVPGDGQDTLVRPKQRNKIALRKMKDDTYGLCVTSNEVVKVFQLSPNRSSGRKVVLKMKSERLDFSKEAVDSAQFPLLGSVFFGDDELASLLLSDSFDGLEIAHLSVYDGSNIRSTEIQTEGDKMSAGITSIPGTEAMALVYTGSKLIVARPRSVSEILTWLVERERFSDAIDLVGRTPQAQLRQVEGKISQLGDQYLMKLQLNQDWSALSEALPRVILVTTFPAANTVSDDQSVETRVKERWISWIDKFISEGKTEVIVDVIPSRSINFDKSVYDRVLKSLAQTDTKALVRVLGLWSTDLYDVPSATRQVEVESSKADHDESLNEALMILYDRSNRHDETLQLLLREKSERIFDYIAMHDFYEAIRSKESLQRLYEIDETKASFCLARSAELALPPDAVVPLLEGIGNRRYLFEYLHTLFHVHPELVQPYQKMLLELYCEFGSSGSLLRFLKSSYYSLEDALDTMRNAERSGGGKKFSKEIVFVLQRMGDLVGAIDILLEESHDVDAAIEFAKEQGDNDLWEKLLQKARTDDVVLSHLLNAPNERINSVQLFDMITEERTVPNLCEKLYRLIIDAKIERELCETCMEMLSEDVSRSMNQLEAMIRKPL